MKRTVVENIISACGNKCNLCPRFLAKEDNELQRVAELWYQVGYRERIVSNSKIECRGCTITNPCFYRIIQCVTDKGVNNCGQCPDYPCERIKEVFAETMIFEPDCRKYCTAEEYEMMKSAFWEKKAVLDGIKKG